MATFSEGKMARAKAALHNLLLDLSETQIDELEEMIHKHPRNSKKQASSTLFKIPGELRNEVFKYVAADAHASVHIGPGSSRYALQDANGQKVRPGILGACHELHVEFHGLFYSPGFIDARIALPEGGWKQVENSKLLDAIVNGKHLVKQFSRLGDRASVEGRAVIATSREHGCGAIGILATRGQSPTATHAIFRVCMMLPWTVTYSLEEFLRGELDCYNVDENAGAWTRVRRSDKCSMCLIGDTDRANKKKTIEDVKQKVPRVGKIH